MVGLPEWLTECALIGESRIQANHRNRGELEMSTYVGTWIAGLILLLGLVQSSPTATRRLQFDGGHKAMCAVDTSHDSALCVLEILVFQILCISLINQLQTVSRQVLLNLFPFDTKAPLCLYP